MQPLERPQVTLAARRAPLELAEQQRYCPGQLRSPLAEEKTGQLLRSPHPRAPHPPEPAPRVHPDASLPQEWPPEGARDALQRQCLPHHPWQEGVVERCQKPLALPGVQVWGGAWAGEGAQAAQLVQLLVQCSAWVAQRREKQEEGGVRCSFP